MGLRINQNIEAFNAHRVLTHTTRNMQRSMEKLSSGMRINRASDDAAGLGISERMRAQISGLSQAQRNAQDGISLVQTAEGALNEVHSILSRVRDLAVQYNNRVYSDADRAAITAEVQQLSDEITRLVGATNFNGTALLSGAGVLATLQIGANDGEILEIGAVDTLTALGTSVSDFVGAAATDTINIQALDDAINTISQQRSTFGAVQNRLEHTVNFLGLYQENLQEAESRIRDVDMAEEMTKFTRLQILQQSGFAMLSQANMAPQSVLSLLGG